MYLFIARGVQLDNGVDPPCLVPLLMLNFDKHTFTYRPHQHWSQPTRPELEHIFI